MLPPRRADVARKQSRTSFLDVTRACPSLGAVLAGIERSWTPIVCHGMTMTLFPLEAGLTASLWDLFAADGPSGLAMEALGRQLPPDDSRVARLRSSIELNGSRAWLPRRAPGADLALVTVDNDAGIADVLAIIEIKAGAPTNWPSNSSAEALPQLSGSVAHSISADYVRDSLDAAINICQADLYRSRQWWTPDDGIKLDDPEEALWLLFDTKGRTVEDAFKNASMPSAWLSIDLKLFAAHLRELRHFMPISEQQNDTVAVVLWHIDQAPGPNRQAATFVAPPAIRRPSTDQIYESSWQSSTN